MAYTSKNSQSSGVRKDVPATGMPSASDAGWFPEHPRNTQWETLKGDTLAPHMTEPYKSVVVGDPRFNGKVEPPKNWDDATVVNTGMTRGGGTFAT